LIEMHESVKAGSKDERDEILMICLSWKPNEMCKL
jgi:hypothetical protein